MQALSVKQKQVCDLVVQGVKNKDIAEKLGISIRTVESHRELIYKKMGVKTAVDLVRLVMAAA